VARRLFALVAVAGLGAVPAAAAIPAQGTGPEAVGSGAILYLNTSYTWANRFTDAPEKAFGIVRFHSDASWIDNRATLSATQHLYDYAGNAMDALGVDKLGGGPDSYTNWFSGCMAGCDSVQSLQLYRFAEPELTRQKDKLVVVSGKLNGPADGSRMQIYRLAGPLPAVPPTFCQIAATSGKLSSPTWSPDGRSRAWADARASGSDGSGTRTALTARPASWSSGS
jgi:hypothetical protein